MGAFDDFLENTRVYPLNLVIKVSDGVTDTYFSKHQVDSGLTVDSDKIKLVDSFKVNPAQVDIRRAKQNINSVTVNIEDKNDVFATFIGEPISALIDLQLSLYVGLIPGNFDFADYILINTYRIHTIKQTGKKYSITAKSPLSKMIKPAFNVGGPLNTTINDTDTTIIVDTDSDVFASTGIAKIESEFFSWSGKSFAGSITTLTGVVRGVESSVADNHSAGAQVVQIEKVVANPIDIILQLMLSINGDGTNGVYDVLYDGAGIDPSEVNITAFTDLKTAQFAGDTFTLRFYDIQSLLEVVENELLLANNLRITEEDGLISIVRLDVSEPGAALPVIDEDVIAERVPPAFEITKNNLVNTFDLEYFYDDSREEYTRKKTFTDAKSIERYGEIVGETLQFKGITSDVVALDRGNKYLDRFKNPQATIKITQLLKTYNNDVGTVVNMIHSDLPNPGSGGLGMNHEVEFLKKTIDFGTGQVKGEYIYTSFINIRRGLIAPCKPVVTKISDKQFTVGAGFGSLYRPGYALVLFDLSTNSFFAEPENTIDTVVGDTITMVNDFVNLAAGTTAIRFADYGLSSIEQTARYAYVAPVSGVFADGTGAYKIF